MVEGDIVIHLTEAFHNITGGHFEILENSHFTGSGDFGYDFVAKMKVGDQESILVFEIKNEVRENILGRIMKKNIPDNYLLMSRYIPSPVKNKLKERRINYLEASGNCYIQTDNIFLYINDQTVTPVRLKTQGKLWKAAGLKFLFAILNNQHLLNFPYRKIASVAGIALGNVGLLIDELHTEGYLKKGTKSGKDTMYLENTGQLIEKWSQLYVATLKPKLMLGRFRFLKKDEERNWRKLKAEETVWGGENAGEILTGFLDPEYFTIYTSTSKMEAMEKLRLVPDQNGKLELVQQFWGEDLQQALNLPMAVPPLLAYAELSSSLDSRNQETAEKIKPLING